MIAETRKRPPFPEHLKEWRNLLPELLEILEEGIQDQAYAYVWLEETSSRSFIASRTENMAESIDRGIVFRIMTHEKNYERATNVFDPSHLRDLARRFRNSVISASSGSMSSGAPYTPLPWPEEIKSKLADEILQQIPVDASRETEVHFAPLCEFDPFATSLQSLQENARHYRKMILERGESFAHSEYPEENLEGLADVRVMFRQNIRTHVFVDRTRNISQVLPISLGYLMGISPAGKMARAVNGGLAGLEAALPEEEQITEAAEMPLKLDHATPLEPGRYQVITGPDVTGVIAHEAFGHTQEGDTWAKGRSIARNLRKDGVRVGNEQASIVNNAGVYTMEGATHGTNGSYYFDHEGQLARPQTILDQGWLSEPMTDLFSAYRLGVGRTANGKRESWRRPIMTRQTNTYFTPGEHTLEEMIGMVEYGFLARHAHGGMEDPKGGSLTAGTEYLEEIRDGKLTGKIFTGPTGGHVELSDPVFDLLDRIVARSRADHEEKIPSNKYGGCGKYHKELVDAGSGGPFILWGSILCG